MGIWSVSLLSILHAAGWPIWPLLAASVFALAVIVERFLSLRRSKVAPAGLEDQVMEMVQRNQTSPEALERLAAHSPLGTILAEVVRERDSPDQKEAVEDAGRAVTFQLSRYTDVLGTIAVASPLMGLFGTVVGMIEIFGAYSPVGGDPAALARGIAIALYNTGFGILIAIPSLIAHRYFRARVDALVFELESVAQRVRRRIGGSS